MEKLALKVAKNDVGRQNEKLSHSAFTRKARWPAYCSESCAAVSCITHRWVVADLQNDGSCLGIAADGGPNLVDLRTRRVLAADLFRGRAGQAGDACEPRGRCFLTLYSGHGHLGRWVVKWGGDWEWVGSLGCPPLISSWLYNNPPNCSAIDFTIYSCALTPLGL